MKQIPNILTLLRFVLAGFFIYFFGREGFGFLILATVCFGLAAATDWLDGYLARKYNVITSFGKIMDPIADKFLMLSAFGLFAAWSFFPWWGFWIIGVREVGLTMFRFWAMAQGKVLAAEKAGKIKTVLQMITAFLILLLMLSFSLDEHRWIHNSIFMCFAILPLLVYMTIAVTLISGLLVLWNNRMLFKQN